MSQHARGMHTELQNITQSRIAASRHFSELFFFSRKKHFPRVSALRHFGQNERREGALPKHDVVAGRSRPNLALTPSRISPSPWLDILTRCEQSRPPNLNAFLSRVRLSQMQAESQMVACRTDSHLSEINSQVILDHHLARSCHDLLRKPTHRLPLVLIFTHLLQANPVS